MTAPSRRKALLVGLALMPIAIPVWLVVWVEYRLARPAAAFLVKLGEDFLRERPWESKDGAP